MNITTIDPAPLLKAWAGFLAQFDWSHFLTLTFRPYAPLVVAGLAPAKPLGPRPGPPPDYAHRAFERFVNDLGRRVGQSPFWFRADEFGEQLGRLHFHALIGGVRSLTVETIKPAWREGFSVVREYDPDLRVAHYLTKYVRKDLADYDMSGKFQRWEARGR